MKYLIDDILPTNQLHMLAGAHHSGKTFLLLQMLDDFRQGKMIWERRSHPVPFVYLTCDRNPEKFQERLNLMGIKDLPFVSAMDLKFKPSGWKWSQRLTALRQLINHGRQKVPNAELFIIDPLTLFVGGKSNDYSGLFGQLYEINQMAREEKITPLSSWHAGKLKKLDQFVRPEDRILGSGGGIGGAIETLLFLTGAKETQDGLATLTIIPRDVPEWEYRLDRAKDGRFEVAPDVEGVIAEHGLLRLIPKPPDWIDKATLAEKAKELLHISEATVKRKLNELIERGSVKRLEHGKYQRVLPN